MNRLAAFFFISYSRVEAADFAMQLADDLEAGPPSIPVWLDIRRLRPGEDWDEQVAEAIRTCRGLIFVLSPDSVSQGSVCKDEWVRALKYKKSVIPLLLHKDAELPMRLGSREYITFTGATAPALARLRKHIAAMDSPEGQLQALKHRLYDSKRELPRADPGLQAGIRDDIAELERQIAEQQQIIDNPAAAVARVQRSIDVGLEGERRPARPLGGVSTSKFVNPPPLVAPTWFQERHFESQQIGEFLKDDSLRLMTIVGRGGVGKSALVCRLLRSLEGGQLPDDGGPLAVDGIVYLSAARSFHRTNLPDLYAGLVSLLPDEAVKRLDAIYKNPQNNARVTMEALTSAFSQGRTVVLLDNFEDMLSLETGAITDTELDEALRAFLELPPHGLKFLITTRVAPRELALVQPGLQARIDLDAGLESPFAENILRAMDKDGKVRLKQAPDALLAKARERTLGYPRALEHLFGILSADRDTSLQQILDDTKKYLPEQVVSVLAGEAFCRLDTTAQHVMQALATYRYPVPAAAVDYLLQPYVPGVDSGRVLSRLANMHFARRDAGRYYLHEVDRNYASTRIAEGQPADRGVEPPPFTRFAFRHRAAEWFKLSRRPREEWKSLEDLSAQLSEFELRYDGGDYDAAAALLSDIGFDYLFLWGHYQLMSELHERLRNRVTDDVLAQNILGNLGSAFVRMGRFEKAVDLYHQALALAADHGDRVGQGAWLGNLATCVSELGEHARALDYLGQSLPIRREIGDRNGEALDLSLLGSLASEVGNLREAIEYGERALAVTREIGNRADESRLLCNLGGWQLGVGSPGDAHRSLHQAMTLAKPLGYRLIEAGAMAVLGEYHIARGEWREAVARLQEAIDIGDTIGNPQLSHDARSSLALAALRQGDLQRAHALLHEAQAFEVPLSNHETVVLRGIVALRLGDSATARDAFAAATTAARHLLRGTPRRYKALDTVGLGCCGLALCGDATHLSDARSAFAAARRQTADAGIVLSVLLRFDALATPDAQGILAAVRPFAAGVEREETVH